MGAGGSSGRGGKEREWRCVAGEEASVCLPALEVFPCLLSALLSACRVLGNLWCPCELVKQCTCGGFVNKPRE